MTTLRWTFRSPLEQEPREPIAPPPSSAARLLALAHHIEAEIQAGTIPDYATAARSLGLTRARLTRVMKLLLLAPGIQERVLMGEVGPTERRMRALVRQPEWREQLDDAVLLSKNRAP